MFYIGFLYSVVYFVWFSVFWDIIDFVFNSGLQWTGSENLDEIFAKYAVETNEWG